MFRFIEAEHTRQGNFIVLWGMLKKANKKIAQTKRHFGVVLEIIDSKLDLVVEGQQTLDKKIDGVDEKVENLKEEMNYKFGIVFDELHLIRNELKEKVGRDEFIFLEKRVLALEKARK
ncbi:MAG: hypothetical protein AAB696_00020 [Patescibacteria group bacterium]